MGAEKRARAEGASLLPQAVGGSAKRLEPTRVTFVFPLCVFPRPLLAPPQGPSPSEQTENAPGSYPGNPCHQNKGLQPRSVCWYISDDGASLRSAQRTASETCFWVC